MSCVVMHIFRFAEEIKVNDFITHKTIYIFILMNMNWDVSTHTDLIQINLNLTFILISYLDQKLLKHDRILSTMVKS